MQTKPTIVILTGAGISAESGLKTFRDSDGLWENYRIEDVATPQGWQKNKEAVIRFYNERRAQAATANPNDGHKILVELEEKYEVFIVTQNVDDLHERAGSSNILHLHGMLREVRSSVNPDLVYDVGEKPIRLGDKCELGSQLRPNVVWFGEQVPNIVDAMALASKADIFIVIGTSMAVYPAASLIYHVPKGSKKYLIDPNIPDFVGREEVSCIPKKASEGVRELVDYLMKGS